MRAVEKELATEIKKIGAGVGGIFQDFAAKMKERNLTSIITIILCTTNSCRGYWMILLYTCDAGRDFAFFVLHDVLDGVPWRYIWLMYTHLLNSYSL
jgi:hypothetical protein